MGDLTELLERVKAATVPDQEMDADLWLAVVPDAMRRNVMAAWPDEQPIWEYSDPDRNLIGRHLVPRLTASIDAALALLERMLPGHDWMLDKGSEISCAIWRTRDLLAVANSIAATPPLAILAALLSALNDEGKGR
jgi:hypothetical protein